MLMHYICVLVLKYLTTCNLFPRFSFINKKKKKFRMNLVFLNIKKLINSMKINYFMYVIKRDRKRERENSVTYLS